MSYEFIQANKSMLKEIFHLYVKRCHWMYEKGIKQWNVSDYLEDYPISYYEKQIKEKRLYVLKKQKKIVSAVVILEKDPRWEKDIPYPSYYVHNLVSDIEEKGAGKVLLEQIELLARKNNKKRIRLDCSRDNDFLNQYYEELGYKPVGIVDEKKYKGNKREKVL